MTEQTVQIILTLKVKENDLSFERPIDISNLEKDISSFSQEIGSQILSMMLKLLDDMLRDIVPDDWKNVGTEKRSVLFECGYIHFKRRVYQDAEGVRHKPLDELLELEPWQRSSRALEEMSSALAATNSYRKASTLLSWLVKAAISPSTTGRYLRKTGQRIQEQEGMALEGEEQGKVETEVLYAEADGVYINLQGEEKKRAEVKVGIIYTGKEAIGKGRNRCINKICITQLGGSIGLHRQTLLHIHIHQTGEVFPVPFISTANFQPCDQIALRVHAHMCFVTIEIIRPYFLFPLWCLYFLTMFDTPSGVRILRLVRVIFIRIDIGFTVYAVDDLDRTKAYTVLAGCFDDLCQHLFEYFQLPSSPYSLPVHAQGGVIRRFLINCQAHKPFGWQVLIEINLRLSFGEIVQVTDQQTSQQECRVIGWSS